SLLRVRHAPASPDPPCSPTRRSSDLIGKFLHRNGPGIQQLAYRVADIDLVCATLRERGLRLLYDEPRRGTSNSRVNFIHPKDARSEEHTSELQSRENLVCRLLLEKKN